MSILGDGFFVERNREMFRTLNYHLGTVDSEIDALKQSEDYLLTKQAEEARSSGRDLIAEHAAQMNDHVEVMRSKINNMSDQLKDIYDG